MIKAEIIKDSINVFGNRLTSTVLDFPRIVLSEFNTHKMISKNSASSRAIPFHKMLEKVQNDPFIPIKWMKDHSGMQGTEYFTNEEVESIGLLRDHLEARDFAMERAIKQNANGLTKQIVNRYLEPFLWHKVLATASEWENFLALRAAEGAEIHIQDLAYKLLDAMNDSKPIFLKEGEWHIPFDTDSLIQSDLERIKVATARCARTSYNNFDGNSDYNKDIELHDKLAIGGHWSPMEHPARVMYEREFFNFNKSIIIPTKDVEQYESNNNSDWFDIIATVGGNKEETIITEFGWCKNYRGFIPYRYLFPNENRRESRLLNKI